MSHFYASVCGGRSEATRQGHESTGIQGHVRGWDSGVRIEGFVDDDGDVFEVWATHGSNGRGGLDVFLGVVHRGPDGAVSFAPAPARAAAG